MRVLLLRLLPLGGLLVVAAVGVSTAEGVRAGEAAVSLERVEVTGTRLPLASAEAVIDLPLTRIDAADLERQGIATFGDWLRGLPINSGGMETTASIVGLGAAASGVNFRGLGGSNVLLLVDGRRVALFGQSNTAFLAADVGNLPAAAIESVEVLREGASALYGSDAIAGVINIRLKRGTAGTHAAVEYRQFEDTDWSRRSASVVTGGTRGATRWTFVVDYSANNDVRFADRPVSRSDDLRGLGGADFRQPYGYPGQLQLPAATPGVPSELLADYITVGSVDAKGVVVVSPPTSTPRASDFVLLPGTITEGRPTRGDSRNTFDRAPWSSVIPAEETYGVELHASHAVSPELELFADLGGRRRRLWTSLHPTPAGTALESAPGVGDGPDGAIIFPATNPYNPFGVDIDRLQFHLVELGPRIRVFTNTTLRGLAGIRGDLGSRWRWEAAAQHSRNTVFEEGRNYITDANLQAGLAGRLGGFINPFGPSDPGVIDRARGTLEIEQSFRTDLVDARVSGELLDLPAGPLAIAAGVEARRENFTSEPRGLAATGGFVGWTALATADFRRDIQAAWFEAGAPLGRRVAVRVAARGENYSDFGNTAKPQAVITWQPVADTLRLRATWGGTYKAPELLDLYLAQNEFYAVAPDPRRPDLGPYAFRYRTGGNPDLQPEEATSLQLGATWTPRASALSGWSFGATWWEFDKRDVVGSLGLDFILEHELDAAFPTADRIVRASSAGARQGEVLLVLDTKSNLNRVLVRGWDFEAAWRSGTRDSGGGEWRLGGLATWLREFTYQNVNGGAVDDLPGRARWKAQGTLGWSRMEWDVALHANWIGHWRGGGVNYAGDSTTQHARVFFNFTASRRFGEAWKAVFTIANLLDEDPPIHYGSNRGYDVGIYDNRGREYAVRVERRW